MPDETAVDRTAPDKTVPGEEQTPPGELLRIHDLHAGYHGGSVLQGIDLSVYPGEAVAILGRNGAGKSTLMYAIAGLLRCSRGTVAFDGTDVTGQPAHSIARRGVTLVPQGRRIWTGLTVSEHLRIAARRSRTGAQWSVPSVLDLLPRLAERRDSRADTLSGGEQQMLAIARALLTNPRLLLMDEPSEGLAPKVVDAIGDVVVGLARSGLTVVLVEQNLNLVASATSRLAIIDRGVIAHESTVESFRHEPELADRLIGVGHD